MVLTSWIWGTYYQTPLPGKNNMQGTVMWEACKHWLLDPNCPQEVVEAVMWLDSYKGDQDSQGLYDYNNVSMMLKYIWHWS